MQWEFPGDCSYLASCIWRLGDVGTPVFGVGGGCRGSTSANFLPDVRQSNYPVFQEVGGCSGGAANYQQYSTNSRPFHPTGGSGPAESSSQYLRYQGFRKRSATAGNGNQLVVGAQRFCPHDRLGGPISSCGF